MKPTDKTVHDVSRAVVERLGAAGHTGDGALTELIAREVIRTLTETSEEQDTWLSPAERRTDSSEEAPGAALSSNGDGTVTTGLGSVLPQPNGDNLPLCASCVEQERRRNSNRAVVTATGVNRRGVIATLSTEIYRHGGDIEEVSQTIVSDYFTLIFVVDLRRVSIPFAELKDIVQQSGQEMGIKIVVLHEDVMQSLQRV